MEPLRPGAATGAAELRDAELAAARYSIDGYDICRTVAGTRHWDFVGMLSRNDGKCGPDEINCSLKEVLWECEAFLVCIQAQRRVWLS